jgi:hypothetical protein
LLPSINPEARFDVVSTFREVVARMAESEESLRRSRRNGDGQAAIPWAMAGTRRDDLPTDDFSTQCARNGAKVRRECHRQALLPNVWCRRAGDCPEKASPSLALPWPKELRRP